MNTIYDNNYSKDPAFWDNLIASIAADQRGELPGDFNPLNVINQLGAVCIQDDMSEAHRSALETMRSQEISPDEKVNLWVKNVVELQYNQAFTLKALSCLNRDKRFEAVKKLFSACGDRDLMLKIIGLQQDVDSMLKIIGMVAPHQRYDIFDLAARSTWDHKLDFVLKAMDWFDFNQKLQVVDLVKARLSLIYNQVDFLLALMDKFNDPAQKLEVFTRIMFSMYQTHPDFVSGAISQFADLSQKLEALELVRFCFIRQQITPDYILRLMGQLNHPGWKFRVFRVATDSMKENKDFMLQCIEQLENHPNLKFKIFYQAKDNLKADPDFIEKSIEKINEHSLLIKVVSSVPRYAALKADKNTFYDLARQYPADGVALFNLYADKDSMARNLPEDETMENIQSMVATLTKANRYSPNEAFAQEEQFSPAHASVTAFSTEQEEQVDLD